MPEDKKELTPSEQAEADAGKDRALTAKEEAEAASVLSNAMKYLKEKVDAVPTRGGKESDGVKGARSTLAHCAGLLEAEAARLTKEG